MSYEGEIISTFILECPRCGQYHFNVKFLPLLKPTDEATHYCLCENNGEPLLVKLPKDRSPIENLAIPEYTY